MAAVVAPKTMEGQGAAEASPAELEQHRGFTVTRRRPIHPGRFLDFARRWFGALSHDARYPGAAAYAGAEASASSSQPSRGRSSWLGSLCRRRQQPVQHAAVAKVCSADPDALLLHTADVRPAGQQWVHAASGTIWFVNCDDRKARWVYEAPSCASGTRHPGRHKLRCGSPWEMGELGQCGEAGERSTELSFVLRHTSDDMEECADEALSAIETRIRRELETCFLTRAEAGALDAGENLEGMAEWEALRLMQTEMASFAASWWPALTALEALVGLISIIPGASQVAAVGEAISDRTSRALGHVPDHHGDSDAE